MGLLSSYGNFNKVTNTALQVKYAVEPDSYDYTGWVEDEGAETSTLIKYSRPFFRIHRYATKSYSYVGMDDATALSCQSDKIAMYTRPYSRVIMT